MHYLYKTYDRKERKKRDLKLLVVEPFQEFAPSCLSTTWIPACWKGKYTALVSISIRRKNKPTEPKHKPVKLLIRTKIIKTCLEGHTAA